MEEYGGIMVIDCNIQRFKLKETRERPTAWDIFTSTGSYKFWLTWVSVQHKPLTAFRAL